MKCIRIKPCDTLFFRDNKPFSMGNDTVGNSMLMPYPSVFYGAMRTAYFKQNPEYFKYLRIKNKIDTDEDVTKKLVIKKICLKDKYKSFYPVPLDCLIEKDDDSDQLFRMISKENKTISSYPLGQIFNFKEEEKNSKEEKKVPAENYYFSNYYLELYLNNNSSEIFYKSKLNDFFYNESKIGIKIDRYTKNVEESCLYNINMVRLDKKYEFCVEVDGFEKLKGKFDNLKKDKLSNVSIKNTLENDILKLGGENKYSRMIVKDNSKIDIKFPKFTNDDKYFCMYLATPAIFANGNIPDFVNEKMNGCLELPDGKNISVELISAAVGKPLIVGGYDMKQNMDKTMYKAVPAGSVYIFKVSSDNLEVLNSYQGMTIMQDCIYKNSINEIIKQDLILKGKSGFGIVYFGKYEIKGD